MKSYIAYFSEKVCMTRTRRRFNRTVKEWEDFEYEEWQESFEFSSLRDAKAFIKKNIDKYVGSSIYQTWSNGDFECLGSINLKGSNKTFVANTRQKKANY